MSATLRKWFRQPPAAEVGKRQNRLRFGLQVAVLCLGWQGPGMSPKLPNVNSVLK